MGGPTPSASASKDKNVTYQRAGELRTQLRLDVDALPAPAEAIDREDTDPQVLPAEIARRDKLLGKRDTAWLAVPAVDSPHLRGRLPTAARQLSPTGSLRPSITAAASNLPDFVVFPAILLFQLLFAWFWKMV